MPLLCPECHTTDMTPDTDPGTKLEIDVCPTCNGIWFDAHELSRFLQSATLRDRILWTDRPQASQADDVPRKCPRCLVHMDLKSYRGVTLDVCPQCQGTWFDSGEVRAVVDRHHQGTGGDQAIQAELRQGFQENRVLQALVEFFQEMGDT